MENGLLMRKWCSDVADGAEWTSVYQIVIPSCYRQQVLSLAHDHDLSGHLGIKKTYYRVLRHFFWPRLKTDVTRFFRTCRVCQITGKPNQVIPCAPLVPIPAVGEPFEHVIVDCVGPLPKSKAGNQFLLTIMCTATRFPEAIPLRKITAPVVTRALVKFFSTFGLPKVVQSDQGTNFLSKIFTQVLSSLNISHRIASAYHAESQGALERFHQTLKSMLRKYCMETSKEWDEGVPMLLFAIRETVQESLGFSPAELVFGHTVRGPLKMLKEDLMSSGASPSLNVLDYVSKFRERLHKACSVAKESLEVAQRKMKRLFDRKSVQRSFNEGDQVLVLLPMVGSALSARFSGPYEVVRKLSNTDYVIGTPDRKRKTRVCHVNMLKTFYCREGIQSDVSPTEETAVHLSSPAPASVACAAVEISNPDDDDDGVIVRHTYQQCARLKNSEVAVTGGSVVSGAEDEGQSGDGAAA
uniref:Gypsy retrotransposon integrase-like protein 1 n=2 Tax=Gasterosteus aculeatus aculeatus TaxID=481459 RepID=A0AAQ4S121_GASAC